MIAQYAESVEGFRLDEPAFIAGIVWEMVGGMGGPIWAEAHPTARSRVGRGDEAVVYAEKAVEIFEVIESPHAAKARARLGMLRG